MPIHAFECSVIPCSKESLQKALDSCSAVKSSFLFADEPIAMPQDDLPINLNLTNLGGVRKLGISRRLDGKTEHLCFDR